MQLVAKIKQRFSAYEVALLRVGFDGTNNRTVESVLQ